MFRNRGGEGFKNVSVAFLLETRNSNSVSLSDLQKASPKSTVLVFFFKNLSCRWNMALWNMAMWFVHAISCHGNLGKNKACVWDVVVNPTCFYGIPTG